MRYALRIHLALARDIHLESTCLKQIQGVFGSEPLYIGDLAF